MSTEQITVHLIGGPPDWDGRTIAYPAHVLDQAREDIGAYLITSHPPERGEDEDPDPRAVYTPDEEPAPATTWRFRGWFPASPTDPPAA